MPSSDNKNSQSWLIIGVTMLILIVFWGILIFLLLNGGINTPVTLTSSDPVSTEPTSPDVESVTQATGQVLVPCPVGQCATNIYSGQKRCPSSSSGTIISDAGTEVCNPPNFCTSSLTPFALLTDGSTNSEGVCEPETVCRCIRTAQCPAYITSIFETTDGNPYLNLNGQRTTFVQTGTSTSVIPGTVFELNSINLPISYDNPVSSFCTVPLPWLSRSSPGCGFIDGSVSSIAACMGVSQGCEDQPVSSPCIRGTLAYISEDSNSFTSSDISNTPLGCVIGETCPCGQIAVYDTKLGNIVCKDFTET